MSHYRTHWVIASLIALLPWVAGSGRCDTADWQPVRGQIMTRWASDVSPDMVWPEYPRPQLVRKEWLSLNGLWDFSFTGAAEYAGLFDKAAGGAGGGGPAEGAGMSARAKSVRFPSRWNGKIMVPFPVESALSGVKRAAGEKRRLWYRRVFNVPDAWRADAKRVLLHFGAVDWEAVVWVNGKRVGQHRGGYTPFGFDVTPALRPGAAQELVVAVWDPTDRGTQPRGKQSLQPRGIWYTPVSGIWQTVWLEPVPASHIRAVRIVPDVSRGKVRIGVEAAGAADCFSVFIETGPSGSGRVGKAIDLKIMNPRLWSPDTPHLYRVRVELSAGGRKVDSVESYFGMREVCVRKDSDGFNRIVLNGRPLFQFGILDQGWWPDGLYTAPTDEALCSDITTFKELGFNMVRKNLKVEPARWYYHCDRLGLLVWQDMPNANNRNGASHENFERELREVMTATGNHPCIVMWVLFNEGRGQYDADRIARWIKGQDPTRLVNATSGWNDTGSGDVLDAHSFPDPVLPDADRRRALVQGEFGGLGLPLDGHLWRQTNNWGYRNFSDRESMTTAYGKLLERLQPMIRKGLCAAVYAQATDVESEVNGLMTYDREVIKIEPECLREFRVRLCASAP